MYKFQKQQDGGTGNSVLLTPYKKRRKKRSVDREKKPKWMYFSRLTQTFLQHQKLQRYNEHSYEVILIMH